MHFFIKVGAVYHQEALADAANWANSFSKIVLYQHLELWYEVWIPSNTKPWLH